MDNQHRLIKGYRDLSQEEIDLINLIKALGNDLNALIDRQQVILHEEKMQSSAAWHAERQAHDDGGGSPFDFAPSSEQRGRDSSIDRACTALYNARMPLQTGIMWLIRSVARPEGF